MALEADQMLLHYRLVEKIGEGGMGVVWKAVDTSLDREVAIKVLPEAVASDAGRMGRFQREAKLLASINHPNIAAVYGLHQHDGLHFLAMELVGGQDLAQRLSAGRFSVEQAVPVARQILDALEAAHDNDIIHRDLKPANILIDPEGKVKVLDFGLAKGMESSSPGGDPSLSPTVTSLGTVDGAILGTAAYMSPEQARGNAADRRADVWSFGCVLYEMVTGTRPFQGDTISDTLAAVLKTEPDWSLLPGRTPPALARLLRRCLAKRRGERLRDVADARLDLDEAEREPGSPAAAGPEPRARAVLPWAVAVLMMAAAAAAWFLGPEAPAPTHAVRFRIPIGTADLTEGAPPVALSPDGSTLAYAAVGKTVSQIYLRRIDELEARPLQGAEDGRAPFFSPDGQWLGFFSRGMLKKISVLGGRPVELCDVPHAAGGASWGVDGRIIFATTWARNGLMRVSENGGPVEQLTEPDVEAGENYHRWPQILPGGRSVLFTSFNIETGYQVNVLSLDDGTWRPLPGILGRALYAPSGHLIHGDSEMLLAVGFDLRRMETVGTPVLLADSVSQIDVEGAGAAVQISGTGTLAYLPRGKRRVAWATRDGTSTPLDLEGHYWENPVLSHDGKWLAIGGNQGATVLNLERGGKVELDDTIVPKWFPGGRDLVYSTRGGTIPSIARRRADGGGSVEKLVRSEHACWASDVSPDGRHVVYYEQHPDTSRDIWVHDLEGGSDPEPWEVTPANERSAQFSPDGNWIAYTSNRSGRDEVYVRRFQGSEGQDTLVSNDGGREPVWSADGTELFYRTGNRLMAVPVTLGASFEAGQPQELFQGNFSIQAGGMNQMYDVAPDGRRFVVVQERDPEAWVHVIVNWPAALAQR